MFLILISYCKYEDALTMLLDSGFDVLLLKFCKVIKDSLLFFTGCLARFISMCSNKLGGSFFLKSTSYFDCIYYLTYSENFV